MLRASGQSAHSGRGQTVHRATSTQAIDVSPYHSSRLIEGVVPSKPQVAVYSDVATYGSRRVIVEDDSFDFRQQFSRLIERIPKCHMKAFGLFFTKAYFSWGVKKKMYRQSEGNFHH